jgi:hypothetical protein
LFGLTEAEIQALLPRDVFRLAMHHAVRQGDLKLARDAARDWAPYEHARVGSQTMLTPEELVRLAQLARAELKRRGMIIDRPADPARGTAPS